MQVVKLKFLIIKYYNHYIFVVIFIKFIEVTAARTSNSYKDDAIY